MNYHFRGDSCDTVRREFWKSRRDGFNVGVFESISRGLLLEDGVLHLAKAKRAHVVSEPLESTREAEPNLHGDQEGKWRGGSDGASLLQSPGDLGLLQVFSSNRVLSSIAFYLTATFRETRLRSEVRGSQDCA